MLTDKDINKLLGVFATKQDIRGLAERMDTFEGTQREILRAVDGLVTPMEELKLEYAAVKEQTSRHERWIKRISRKTGVSLKE